MFSSPFLSLQVYINLYFDDLWLLFNSCFFFSLVETQIKTDHWKKKWCYLLGNLPSTQKRWKIISTELLHFFRSMVKSQVYGCSQFWVALIQRVGLSYFKHTKPEQNSQSYFKGNKHLQFFSCESMTTEISRFADYSFATVAYLRTSSWRLYNPASRWGEGSLTISFMLKCN